MSRIGARNEHHVSTSGWKFGQFQVDTSERTLRHNGTSVALRDKAFDALVLLLERAPKLVTKELMVQSLWPNLAVHRNNLAVTVSALRKALQELAPGETFVATVPKRGYRWAHPMPLGVVRPATCEGCTASTPDEEAAEPFIGRCRELRHLVQLWEHPETRRSPVAFVSGEAGIGKTTLLRKLAAAASRSIRPATVALGHGIELFGQADPFMPWLEALGHVKAEVASGLLASEPVPRLRQIIRAVRASALEQPLLLCLEDFHWADASSVDALRALCAQPVPPQLMVVVTFRPAELQRLHHPLLPLREDFASDCTLQELALSPWTANQVADYLRAHYDRTPRPSLAKAIWRKTEGSPFFVGRLLQAWVDANPHGQQARCDRIRGCGSRTTSVQALQQQLDDIVAPGISALIRRQLRPIGSEERRVLDAASIIGPELSTSVLSRMTASLPSTLERQLNKLAFDHAVLDRIEEEQGAAATVSVRYRFRHVLLQEHVYEALPSHERHALHLRAARALLFVAKQPSSTDATTPPPRPAQVAAHFGRSGQPEGAVAFWTEAGNQAERAFAPTEALRCYALAEELLPSLPRHQQLVRRLFLRHGQGWAFFNLRNLRLATQHFEQQGRLARELDGSDPDSALARQLAHEYFSRPWCDEKIGRPAQVILSSRPNDVDRQLEADALRSLCHVYMLGEDSEALRDRARRLLELGQTHSTSEWITEGQRFSAIHAFNTGRASDARSLLHATLSGALSCDHDATGSALTRRTLAEVLLAASELNRARTLLETALEALVSRGAKAVATTMLGDTLARLGDLSGAFCAYDDARRLFEGMDPPRPPLHGWFLRELGRLSEAAALDETAVKMARPLGDTHRLSRLLAGLASTQCRLGGAETAERAASEAEQLVGREHRRSAARMHPIWLAQCELYAHWQRWTALLKRADGWLELAGSQGHVEGQMAAHGWMARAHMERGGLTEARAHAQTAASLAEKYPTALVGWRCFALLGEAAHRSGDGRLAAKARRDARRRVRAVAKKLPPSRRREWLAGCRRG